ncbi:MAG: B12-binding domain-containing radical SAM protein, partial [Bradymonadaceae bacterium]
MSSKAERAPCVLLISPGIIKWTDMDFGLPHLVSIGGYIQKHLDIRVEILDLNFEGGDHRRLERTLEDLGPFLVAGISCYSSFDYMRVMSLAKFFKTLYPDVPLITGGYHASALPEDLIFDGSPFDAAVPGEGERTMLGIVETLLGGGKVERKIYPKEVIADMDGLPPYKWELLGRYWPRAHDIGRKFQLYLSRGCPYHCSFCMERSKSGYQWRSFSAERAIDELRRLATFTDLSKWVINLADPLFGFNRKWRRQVLEGIIEHELFPRQYWTLTRSDDLHEEDVELLAKAHFSIGIGMESGSPEMLKIMQKGNKPERYLEAQLRLARLSRKHGLNWAGNIILGHPGETLESLRQTRDFAQELFTSASETCGWLSIDPFRLYPGSHVHENMDFYEERYGAKFHHRQWWTSWYDGPFRAEHIDPSGTVDFETRVNYTYDHFAPLITDILQKFRGQGRNIDRVFKRSLAEQAELMSDKTRHQILDKARWTQKWLESGPGLAPDKSPAALKGLTIPLGLHVKDPWVRDRESAVRQLLERGVLRTDRLIEAFLNVRPEEYLPEEAARKMLQNVSESPLREGDPPGWLGISLYAIALEALNPGLGERAADMLATNGNLSALMAE